MKVILTIGSEHSGYQAVASLLTQAGVASAQASNKSGLTPQTLQAQLLRSHEVELRANTPLAQVQPGKLWNELATDLFLANMQHPNWGWADPQSAVLMDFWHDFDTQVRLLLVYNSPANYLGQVLSQNIQPSAQAIAAALDDWARWNTALLRYLQRHPDYCLLVNSRQATEQPQLLVPAVAAHWQISGLDASAMGPASQPDYQHLQAHLINQLIDPQHPAWALHQELEGAALQVLEPEADTQTGDAQNASLAWADWVQARTKLKQLGDENSKLIAARADATGARAQLSTQSTTEPHANAALQAQIAQASAEATELQQENELLLLQLHQVQEELEHYFLRNQELEKNQNTKAADFVSDFWRMHQPQELLIDMQQDIAGGNWYPAESDGRWAGPATLSTLQMPPVQPGNYTLELDIVDAMNLAMVNELVVETLGQTLPVEVYYPLYQGEYPLICKVALNISQAAAQQAWQVNLRFPRTASPAESGSDDQRHLTARLRSVKLVKQA